MLEAVGLTKRYESTTALDALDLFVRPGEVFCLLGANGAGKTTTINLFLNFVTPSAGLARINGIDVTTKARGVSPSRLPAGVGESSSRRPRAAVTVSDSDVVRLANVRSSVVTWRAASTVAVVGANPSNTAVTEYRPAESPSIR
jgi:ABC-type branched-subunit amino acid transport system ATPase component